MPVTKYADTTNRVYYNAISTAAWAGSEGATLRSQGWTYCGFGTGGVYIAPPGGPCTTPMAPGPNIGPTVPPDTSSGPSSTVADKACGSCRKTAAGVANPITGAPATPLPGAPSKKSGLPWWLWVLVALTLAQVVYNGRNTPSAS